MRSKKKSHSPDTASAVNQTIIVLLSGEWHSFQYTILLHEKSSPENAGQEPLLCLPSFNAPDVDFSNVDDVSKAIMHYLRDTFNLVDIAIDDLSILNTIDINIEIDKMKLCPVKINLGTKDPMSIRPVQGQLRRRIIRPEHVNEIVGQAPFMRYQAHFATVVTLDGFLISTLIANNKQILTQSELATAKQYATVKYFGAHQIYTLLKPYFQSFFHNAAQEDVLKLLPGSVDWYRLALLLDHGAHLVSKSSYPSAAMMLTVMRSVPGLSLLAHYNVDLTQPSIVCECESSAAITTPLAYARREHLDDLVAVLEDTEELFTCDQLRQLEQEAIGEAAKVDSYYSQEWQYSWELVAKAHSNTPFSKNVLNQIKAGMTFCPNNGTRLVVFYYTPYGRDAYEVFAEQLCYDLASTGITINCINLTNEQKIQEFVETCLQEMMTNLENNYHFIVIGSKKFRTETEKKRICSYDTVINLITEFDIPTTTVVISRSEMDDQQLPTALHHYTRKIIHAESDKISDFNPPSRSPISYNYLLLLIANLQINIEHLLNSYAYQHGIGFEGYMLTDLVSALDVLEWTYSHRSVSPTYNLAGMLLRDVLRHGQECKESDAIEHGPT